MKELDVLLSGYLERYYAQARPAARQAFERLLEMQDPDIYSLLLGTSHTEDREITNVIAVVLRQSTD
jgi:succinate dehydrogenase flavin-adding protein (antitoxin of CptAB toxin-antitoxin module)